MGAGFCLLGLFVAAQVGSANADDLVARRAKYAAGVVTLSDDHAFARRNEAADFWRLMPHYAAQPNDSSCSLAVAAMVVNAARPSAKLTAGDELATAASVLAKVDDAAWKRATAAGGEGVSLEQIAGLLGRSLAAYGVDGAKISTVYVAEASPAARRELRDALAANDRSGQDFIVAYVLQSALTGDPEGAVGHLVVVGAFDEKRERVLILDPDRRWYEPYWVSLDALLTGMATRDVASGKSRGYVRIALQ